MSDVKWTNKTTKDHHYQQFARNDLLYPLFVTLDTSHLLMSALNEEAYKKAVVFGGKEEERVRYEMDQIKQQGQNKNITFNNLQGKTYCCPCLSHWKRPTC